MNNEWVFIDTHIPRQSRLGWLSDAGRLNVRTHPGRPPLLLKQLFKDRTRLESAHGICVVAGPGSFSSIRIGVLYANLLARLFHKPLRGVRVEEVSDLRTLYKQCIEDGQASAAYVAPIYDAEPNITLPKSV
ncbi:hypothetical protein KBD61_00350 [Patescibacteria group bacterium]|nr:hypothetical protein [Patescibacteria group bacterium]MBP9709459.1 hypothetical protein [Patescibacteria group bacterium]